mgnify:CR=1 FL=1
MAIDNVREYFKSYQMDDQILEFEVSSAAKELTGEKNRFPKPRPSLVGIQPILLVTAGDTKIDNTKYKHFFGTKAKMILGDEVENIVGHSIGGVCPFAINDNVKVYLDESLKRFETVFPAAGSSNSAIELTIPELEKYSNFLQWVDVCKGWQESNTI